uniref:Uncharacterized protein n=1 Tax=Strombidium rassoulzadegani TaxID=1082188 RepID=A0A7S3FSG6_9SPIT|mmetsp:Transcript_1054/g.1942  ORF Transcript_1054/g.1942 Transcript_1054/m.1942 type:complete len:319 (+) Transcript_1054:1118-2074(+)
MPIDQAVSLRIDTQQVLVVESVPARHPRRPPLPLGLLLLVLLTLRLVLSREVLHLLLGVEPDVVLDDRLDQLEVLLALHVIEQHLVEVDELPLPLLLALDDLQLPLLLARLFTLLRNGIRFIRLLLLLLLGFTRSAEPATLVPIEEAELALDVGLALHLEVHDSRLHHRLLQHLLILKPGGTKNEVVDEVAVHDGVGLLPLLLGLALKIDLEEGGVELLGRLQVLIVDDAGYIPAHLAELGRFLGVVLGELEFSGEVLDDLYHFGPVLLLLEEVSELVAAPELVHTLYLWVEVVNLGSGGYLSQESILLNILQGGGVG